LNPDGLREGGNYRSKENWQEKILKICNNLLFDIRRHAINNGNPSSHCPVHWMIFLRSLRFLFSMQMTPNPDYY